MFSITDNEYVISTAKRSYLYLDCRILEFYLSVFSLFVLWMLQDVTALICSCSKGYELSLYNLPDKHANFSI